MENTDNGKLRRWVAFHALFDRRCFNSDVISTAAGRPITPHGDRVPGSREQHEHIDEAEVNVGVDQDRDDVYRRKGDSSTAEEARQIE